MKIIEFEPDEADWINANFKEGWAVAHAVKLKSDVWEGPGFVVFSLANGAFPWGCESPQKILEICEFRGPEPWKPNPETSFKFPTYFFVKIQAKA